MPHHGDRLLQDLSRQEGRRFPAGVQEASEAVDGFGHAVDDLHGTSHLRREVVFGEVIMVQYRGNFLHDERQSVERLAPVMGDVANYLSHRGHPGLLHLLRVAARGLMLTTGFIVSQINIDTEGCL